MYSYNKDDQPHGVITYGADQVKLLVKNPYRDGFSVEDVDNIHPQKKSFISDTRKIVIDNAAPYGHIITTWIYLLLKELEAFEGPVDILFYKSPDTHHMRLEHSSNVTNYLYERLTEKGYKVIYIDSMGFYINNFTTFLTPISIPMGRLDIVSEFLSEGLDYSKEPNKKIYLSRAKTTTYNGNQNVHIPDGVNLTKSGIQSIREENMYGFSDRIDDEKALEDYLINLGFTIIYPEDIESYKDQLQLFASSKIVMSITSSALSLALAMTPNTAVVELVTPMYVYPDGNGNLKKDQMEYHSHYKDISTIKNKIYIGISNKHHKTSDVINSIESNLSLKNFLSG
jgi:hypothetical protein